MNAVDQDIKEALRFHHSGKLAEAEHIYRRILASIPRHPDALHLLGLIAMQAGQAAAAEKLIRNAIEIRPQFPDALANLGRVLEGQGKNDLAVEAYRKVTELKPLDARAWQIWAESLRIANRSAEALSAAERAAELDPQLIDAHLEIARLQRKFKQFDSSIASCRRALEIDPRSAIAHNSLANSLIEVGQVDRALDEYRHAVNIEPNFADYRVNLGFTLLRIKQPGDALVVLDIALSLAPSTVIAHSARGTALTQLNRYDESLAAHHTAIQLGPNVAESHGAIAETFRAIGETKLAERALKRALELDSARASTWIMLGDSHAKLGDFDQAGRELEKGLELDPNNAIALRHLALIGRLNSEGEVARLRSVVDRDNLSIDHKISAEFGLAKLLDEREDFDEAFARFECANRLCRKQLSGSSFQFDRLVLQQKVDQLISTFVPEFFEQRRDWGDRTQAPVFIVGMPRSGTTLVEQIVSSHPDVFGAGERFEIGYYSQQIGEPSNWTFEKIAYVTEKHLRQLSALAGPVISRIVDKMPGNIMHLGLISILFPQAKVIVCERDPRDICLSCYFQLFAKDSLTFSYDLTDCAIQFTEQERLLSHWKTTLPLQMLFVKYEDMVADQEAQCRRLIDFLGLPWHPACLEFYNTKREVLTASVWQVRQPMYATSVGRWRNYEKHIGPLLRALHLQTL